MEFIALIIAGSLLILGFIMQFTAFNFLPAYDTLDGSTKKAFARSFGSFVVLFLCIVVFFIGFVLANEATKQELTAKHDRKENSLAEDCGERLQKKNLQLKIFRHIILQNTNFSTQQVDSIFENYSNDLPYNSNQ